MRTTETTVMPIPRAPEYRPPSFPYRPVNARSATEESLAAMSAWDGLEGLINSHYCQVIVLRISYHNIREDGGAIRSLLFPKREGQWTINGKS